MSEINQEVHVRLQRYFEENPQVIQLPAGESRFLGKKMLINMTTLRHARRSNAQIQAVQAVQDGLAAY